MAYKLNPFTGKFDYVVSSASEVSVADAGGYFTSTDVEGALQELGAVPASYVLKAGDTMTGPLVLQETVGNELRYLLNSNLTINTAGVNEHAATRGLTITSHSTGSVTNARGGEFFAQIGNTGDVVDLFGSYGLAQLTSTGVASSSAIGVFGDMRNDGTVTQGVGVGVFGSVTNGSTGIISLAASVVAGNISNSGGGSITQAFSFYGFEQTAGATNWGMYDPNNWAIAGDKSLFIGASQDYKIGWDGTDAIYDATLVSAGKHQFIGDLVIKDTIFSKSGAPLYLKSLEVGQAEIPPITDPNIVGYWKFDDGSGTTAVDSVGGYNGTVTNATWVGSGYFGYTGDDSLDFNGTSSYVDLSSHAAALKTATGSIALWFKADVTTGAIETLYGAGALTTNWFSIVLGNLTGAYSDESLGVVVRDSGIDRLIAYVRHGHDYYFDGVWHFLVVTQGGSGLKIYVDGVEQTLTFQVGTSSTSNWTDITTSTSAFIGKRVYTGSPLYFSGVIDNFIYYNDARTAVEVLDDYNNSLGRATYNIIDTNETVTNGTLLSVKNNGTEKFSFLGDGTFSATDLAIDTDLLYTDSTNNFVGVVNSSPASGFDLGSSFALPYVAITTTYTLTATDYTVDCTANTFTVSLPTAVGIAKRIYQINNSGTGVITVDGYSTETINGSLTQTLNQWDKITIQSTGANWIIL